MKSLTMNDLLNTNIINGLGGIARSAPRNVLHAIKDASARTGVDFAYLVKQAAAESSFKPGIKAKTSSATGLYQFIESTWLSMVKKYGPAHGIETAGKSREDILAMRKDPEKASLMAAEFASENEKFLRSHYNGDIGATELYFAHFLGAGQAAAFLNARVENPQTEAAILFPKAARANRNVFYEPATGQARSLQEVYTFFDRKFQTESPEAGPPVKKEEAPSVYAKSAPPPKAQNMQVLNKPAPSSFGSFRGLAAYGLYENPAQIMLMAQLSAPGQEKTDSSDRKDKASLLRAYAIR